MIRWTGLALETLHTLNPEPYALAPKGGRSMVCRPYALQTLNPTPSHQQALCRPYTLNPTPSHQKAAEALSTQDYA